MQRYSMIAVSSAIEALRMANQLKQDDYYQWEMLSATAGEVAASNGIATGPCRVPDLREALPDVVLVCGGWDVRAATNEPTRRLLRALAQRGVVLGGLCTGAYALLEAGLLDGYRCAVHWEELCAFHRDFPAVRFVDEIFAVDRDRLTCTGGTAPLDMMLHLIGEALGPRMTRDISEQFLIECVREPTDLQPIPVPARPGFARAELIEVVRLMEANVEDPLNVPDLARLAGVSMRHLQRVFRQALGVTPNEYYLGVRMRHARKLIRHSNLPIAHVAKTAGFHTSTHFSRAFRSFYGHAPSHERRPPTDARPANPSRSPIPFSEETL
ncbi:GlxA family transcriptional regulator [Burkholderia sp. Ac-20379]|uniref:GlxA family transcriptional regulator n=1 Tax=Burkholderia sp. Ac-20379 TaxID=2703900 RepID=UPI001F11C053|nr:GlxA family transcriptional regulator [Burkholderia sp. Ac-20379]